MTSTNIRPSTAGDVAFIYNTWLKSYRQNSKFAKEIDKEVYYTYHRKVIERILERGGQVLVAADVEAPDTIYGYIVVEAGRVVHFGYVKKAFRNLGIFTELLNAAGMLRGNGFIFTHNTDGAKKLCESKKDDRIIYNPYFL